MESVDRQIEILTRGTAQVLPAEALKKKLATGKPLRIKLGMDPTAPDLHLGHAVVLKKMRQFQDLGHEIIFLIGDYTARIGDPTGRSKTRPALTQEQIEHNTKTYFEQVGRILDPEKVTVRYNSEWLDALTSSEMIAICAQVTLAQIIEREDFANRLSKQQPIGFHELFYPLMQGYDSVALKADVELGGTDQTFNLLMGRHLQEQYKQSPQVIMTVPILEGLDGVQKMSKSLGNAIGLMEEPSEAFGKLMSVSDDCMWRYYQLLLDKNPEEIAALKAAVANNTQHPMALKKAMAHGVIAQFWSTADADSAQAQFEQLFQKKDYSAAKEIALPADTENPLWIVSLLKALGAISSSSEAKRLIQSGAVIVDGEPVKEFKAEITWQPGMTIKVGKHRIYQITA